MEENAQEIKYYYNDVELTEKVAVAYYKQAHYFEKLENKLLGNFDATGKYTISNEILKELVAIKKIVDNNADNKIFASAKCGKYKLKFVVEFGDIDKGNSYASMKLIEEFSQIAGEKKTLIFSPVVYYKDAKNDYFKDKIYKIFNLNNKIEGEGQELNNEEFAKLIIKSMSIMENGFANVLKETKSKDKLYVENMLKIFEKSGKFGEFALRRYNFLLKEYAGMLNPKADNYYRILKQLIDKIMLEEEKNISKEVAILIQKLRNNYVASVDNIIEVVIKNPPHKVEEKPIKLKGTGGLSFKPSVYKSTSKSNPKPKYRTASEGDSYSNTSSSTQTSSNLNAQNGNDNSANMPNNWLKTIAQFEKEVKNLEIEGQTKKFVEMVDEAPVLQEEIQTVIQVEKTFDLSP